MAANVAAINAAMRRKKAGESPRDGEERPESPGFEIVDPPTMKDTPVILPMQAQVFKFYNWQPIQLFVAGLIVANFFVNILEKEIDPYPAGLQLYPEVWSGLADFFNAIFLVELLLNFYGSFFVPFWKSGWNIFDFIVVAVGTISLARVDMGPGNLLRLLRAFRVFRLFKRIKSLNKIIVSLGKAIPGVANAFLIMVIFMCIFAILGVEFFSQFGPDGTMTTYQDHGQRGIDWTNLTGLPIENGDCDEINGTVAGGGCVVVPLVTARGYTYGEEYYGTFFRALYTLFQVMTGESWSEAVARPTLFGYVNPQIGAVLTGLFYVSFIIITQIIMINVRRRAQFAARNSSARLSPHCSDALYSIPSQVVVAVLLEKMVEEDPPSEEPEQEEGALSPVKSTNMAHLQTQVFEMRAEITTISEQMKLVLKALGADGSGVKQKRRPSANAPAPAGTVLGVVDPLKPSFDA